MARKRPSSETVTPVSTESPDPSQSESNSNENETNNDDSGSTDSESVPDSSDDTSGGQSESLEPIVQTSGDDSAPTGPPGGDTPDPGQQSQETQSDDGAPLTERQRVERASKLRRKARKVALNDEESAFLAEYESTKKRPGRQPKEPKAATPEPVSTKSAPTPEVLPPKQSTPKPSKPRLASTPIVHESKSGASWRAKYKGASETGRELVCIQFGDAWHRLLVGMETQLSEAGIAPIVAVSGQETRDMLILAVHDILPPWVEATPAIVAAYQTTALCTQRLLKAGAIKKAMEAKTRPMTNLSRPVSTPKLESIPERAVAVEETPALAKVEKPKEEVIDGGLRVNSTGRFI